ncbi:hypothetical protein BTEBP_40157 [Brochothrix thermosphacta]|nr:hypothetical protein BTEBP_40157 [Brochothrix thermosphacta]
MTILLKIILNTSNSYTSILKFPLANIIKITSKPSVKKLLVIHKLVYNVFPNDFSQITGIFIMISF